ncbi:MAG: hypothetical protein QG650_932 [Patescibacteria group bacterium]|nr:hypothetical protein [Patescibacteria group bacterium]
MKTFVSLFAFFGLLSAFSVGEVFADAGTGSVKTETGKTAATPKTEAAEDSGEPEDSEEDVYEREREKQKAIDDVNAFLIESYKIKLDKLLDEVYRSVRVASKDDPALQTLLLRRVLSEIEAKMQSISERNITPNRKKILIAVFSYLKSDIESKIRALGGK